VSVLTVVCFKWENPGGFQLPSQKVTRYKANHVKRLQSMVARHYSRPHRFVCITDDSAGLEGVETIPLWPEYRALGGCYHRLQLFGSHMRELLGPRFVMLDLDVVITGDLTPVFERTEDFVINSYRTTDRDQRYNGSIIMMDAGARAKVWETFDPVESIRAIEYHRRTVIGTDQAWIRLALGPDEATLTDGDGVHDIRFSKSVRSGLPKNARIVVFPGPRDQETEMKRHKWIKEHWA
jgi:hypothetical protein